MTNSPDPNNPERDLRRKLDNKSDGLKSDIARLEGKIDIILQHITGIAE